MSSNFKNIVDFQKWQNIQTHLSEILKVNLHTIDKEGLLLTPSAVYPRLCNKLMKATVREKLKCEGCSAFSYKNLEQDWKEGHVCLAGLYNFFIPLAVKGEITAYLVIGPVILGKYRKIEIYAEVAKNLNMNPEEFLDALKEIKVFSFYGIRSLIELLYDIGRYACELTTQDISLKNIMPGASDTLKNQYNSHIEKSLTTLLDLSCVFSGAERGSIMLLDEKNDELYIKIAKGLKNEIIKQARVKVGEGLAGIVARKKEPLFIDEKNNEERIQFRLNNSHLTYSMLIPIKKKDKLWGVLNISTSNANPDKFTAQNAKIIDMLIQSATT